MCLVFPAENLQCLRLISGFSMCQSLRKEPSQVNSNQIESNRIEYTNTQPKNLFAHPQIHIHIEISLCIDLCAYELANLGAFHTLWPYNIDRYISFQTGSDTLVPIGVLGCPKPVSAQAKFAYEMHMGGDSSTETETEPHRNALLLFKFVNSEETGQ